MALTLQNARAEYNADDILMSPPTEGESFRVAQVQERERSESAPSTASPDRPYSKVKKPQIDETSPETAKTTPKAAAVGQKSPVDYAADTADYDQQNKVVTLLGKVELTQEGRTLNADRVVYNLKDDIASAEGNVVITDVNGDVHKAESVELSDKMRKGLIEKLFTTMADGSRVWAAEGRKESETLYKLEDAKYTACKACEKDPSKRPPWTLNAKEVELQRDKQRVVYHHAWLEMGGVPVLYTPYFSHPDGTVKQKSGFLTPSFGWNNTLGGFYAQPYYWAISPSTDTTFTVMPTTKEGPLLRNEFRKRYENAYFETDASITNSSRTDSVGNVSVDKGEEVRGHFFGEGGWDINDHWRGRANINLTSDEQYLRQYGLSDDSILKSSIAAERFEGRDYAIIQGLAFQDLRTDKTDQPNILPFAQMSMMGDPNATLGGRWEWDSSLLALTRDGNGQDVWRGSTRASWQRQDIMPVGLLFTTELGARADLYATTNRIEASTIPGEEDSKQEGRFIPNAQLTASYPMKSSFKTLQLRVEPVATLYMAPDVDNSTDFPNEDSLDVQLDAGNLLDGNRFPGLDRVEDKSHVAYGLRTGLYNYTGGRVSTFLGQSYNFDDDNNAFPAGSGLETQSSDYVGSVNASFDGGRHDVSYRFQVDSDTMGSQRHELYGQTGWNNVALDGYYLYAAGEPGTAYEDSREQVRLGSTVGLTDGWSVRGDVIYDLSDVKAQRGLRRSVFTLNYDHECYNAAVTADRYLADESSGVQDTTIMFRIGLKNLGEYTTDVFSSSSETTQNR